MHKITIEETKTVKKMVGKEWTTLSEKDGEKKRGYTPEIEKEIEEKRIIYIQIVEDLNLAVVIQAINDIL